MGLILLDLSAAFNTVVHNVLLPLLEHAAGTKSPMLQYCESHLYNTLEFLHVNGETSSNTKVNYGVAQSFVLQLILFTYHTFSLLCR